MVLELKKCFYTAISTKRHWVRSGNSYQCFRLMDSSKGDYRTWKKNPEYINLTKYKVFSIFFLKVKIRIITHTRKSIQMIKGNRN